MFFILIWCRKAQISINDQTRIRRDRGGKWRGKYLTSMIVYLEVHSTNVVVVSPARRHMRKAHSLQVVKCVVTAWHVCLEYPHIYFLAWHFHILPQNQVPSLAGAIPSKNLSQFWAIRDSFWEITNVLVVSPARRHISKAHTHQIVKCVVATMGQNLREGPWKWDSFWLVITLSAHRHRYGLTQVPTPGLRSLNRSKNGVTVVTSLQILPLVHFGSCEIGVPFSVTPVTTPPNPLGSKSEGGTI